MIIRLFYEGGPSFMSLVYLLWIIVFIQTVRGIILYRGDKNPQKLKQTNNSILFLGSLAFLIGITGQMVGLITSLDTIQATAGAGIDTRNLAGGLKVTFIVPIFGLMLLILSSIIWFVFRSLTKYPSQIAPIN